MRSTFVIFLIVGVLLSVAAARYLPRAAVQAGLKAAYNGRNYYTNQDAYAKPMEGK